MVTARGLVLVVDDSPQIRELIRVNLELEGYRVVTAEDGSAALARIRDLRPDVMTIDVRMPGKEGFEVVEAVRADPEIATLGVVMVTACAQEVDRRRAEQVGVDVYISKPFEPEHLIAEVGRVAVAARARRAREESR